MNIPNVHCLHTHYRPPSSVPWDLWSEHGVASTRWGKCDWSIQSNSMAFHHVQCLKKRTTPWIKASNLPRMTSRLISKLDRVESVDPHYVPNLSTPTWYARTQLRKHGKALLSCLLQFNLFKWSAPYGDKIGSWLGTRLEFDVTTYCWV